MSHPFALLTGTLPHRYPMLLIDRLESLEPRRRGVAFKLVSAGELQAEGVDGFPATLLVDALGQLAILVLAASPAEAGAAPQPGIWYLAALESLRLGEPAEVGDEVRMEVEVERSWRGTSRVAVRATTAVRALAQGVMVLAAGGGREQANPGTRAR
jgi:3-hydroxyacyl-[acyl-carrier-protein] dehydratase